MTYSPLHIVGLGGTLRANSRSFYALDHALHSAEAHGARITRFSMLDLNLPMFDPTKVLKDCDEKIQHFIETMRSADGMIWSTGAYHGTLAGVTKNALDYMEYLSGGDNPYLHNKIIGLIATAGGDMAGVNSVAAMVHCVHSLRGIVAPLMVAIPHAGNVFNKEGQITEGKWATKLDSLGKQVVEIAMKQRQSITAATS